MKVKYFDSDGKERIEEMREKPDGTIILPKEMAILCSCKHEGQKNLWPATVVLVTAMASIVTVVALIVNG